MKALSSRIAALKVMTSSKLTWSQIVEMYDGEWVELTDCRWDWEEAHPGLARVRHHASDRLTLMEQVRQAPKAEDSAILYISAEEMLSPSLIASLSSANA